MMMGHDGWGTGSWLTMSVLMVIPLALLITGTVWLITRRRESAHNRSARQILDERFARGELAEADYRRHRDLLSPVPDTGVATTTTPSPGPGT